MIITYIFTWNPSTRYLWAEIVLLSVSIALYIMIGVINSIIIEDQFSLHEGRRRLISHIHLPTAAIKLKILIQLWYISDMPIFMKWCAVIIKCVCILVFIICTIVFVVFVRENEEWWWFNWGLLLLRVFWFLHILLLLIVLNLFATAR